ncbi:MAG TPA: hypothetical protein VNJ01_06470 [Bacteriovoracaceae bacterium]|nr:hypothetical protein [Bacteriovoracaceae bacterium]
MLLTSGFIGKYGLFNSVVNAGEVPLVVIAVLTSVVSVYYYLRVIVYMFMKESTAETAAMIKLIQHQIEREAKEYIKGKTVEVMQYQYYVGVTLLN